MARKKTFLLNHELIDGIRFLDASQFKEIICGLADIDERKEPETKDPIALAFINMQKGFILENAEKWEKRCVEAQTAREKRADLARADNSGARADNSGARADNSGARADNSGARADNSGARADNSGARADNSGASSVSVSVSDPVSDPVSVSENVTEKENVSGNFFSPFFSPQQQEDGPIPEDAPFHEGGPPPWEDGLPLENGFPPGEDGWIPEFRGAAGNRDPPPGQPAPEGKPVESRKDAAAVWNLARQYWNGRGLKPECRDIVMRAADAPEILRTIQYYPWEEIKNAIGNYAWHKTKAGPEYRPPPPYGSLAGFLKTGVEKYVDDDALDSLFKEKRE